MSTVSHFKSNPGTIGDESFKVARVLKNRKKKSYNNVPHKNGGKPGPIHLAMGIILALVIPTIIRTYRMMTVLPERSNTW